MAFDVHAKAVVWNVTVRDEVGGGSGGTASASQPLIGCPDVVAFVEINVLVLRSRHNGKLISNYSLPYMPNGGGTNAFVCGRDTLVLSFGSQVLWTVDMRSGEILWKSEPTDEPMRKYIFPQGHADTSLFVVSRRDGHEAYPCRWSDPRTPSEWPRPLWRTSLPNVTGDNFDFWRRPVVLLAPAPSSGGGTHNNGVVLTSMNYQCVELVSSSWTPVPFLLLLLTFSSSLCPSPSLPNGLTYPYKIYRKNITSLDLATGHVVFSFVGDIKTLYRLAPRTASVTEQLIVGGVRVVYDGSTSGSDDQVQATAWDSSSGDIIAVGPTLGPVMSVTGSVWEGGAMGAAVYAHRNIVMLATLPPP